VSPCLRGSSSVRIVVVAAILAVARTALAGQDPVVPVTDSVDSPLAYSLPVDFAGPPPPIAPEVITRDQDGRATVRAIHLTAPLRIDGGLDEALYRDVAPMSDFFQVEPQAGAPATERTDVWLAYDEDNVYVSVRCWDTSIETLIASEMRRDSSANWQGNDILSFIFDTYYDRRNSIAFTVNPLGGRSDGTYTNERLYSSDWNPVWSLKTGRIEGGWTIEAAIPFKSLRYQPGRTQIWGFNVMRVKRSKNEISTLTKVPPARGQSGFQQASYAATVVGLEVPSGGRVLDLKPYVTSNLTTDRATGVSNDPGGDIGFDAKYSVTQNLTADFTYNTDFAQVEVDEQQVNLTRFSLFFPEKREFFLENQGTFAFGGVAVNSTFNTTDAPILFYSRRIGLNRGRAVPLDVGGRLTGRAGAYSLGVLNLQTGDEATTATASTNFTVVRVKRDILRKSSVGLIATNRSVGVSGAGSNQAYGVDGTFAFFEDFQVNTYWARTATEGRRGNDRSYRAQLDYPGDRYGLQVERMAIGADFNPEVGFVRRTDMVRDYLQARFSPRPRTQQAIRKYVYQGHFEYIENGAGRLESREREGEIALEFQNGDRLGAIYTNSFEYLPRPFAIGGDVVLPIGAYQFDNARVNYNMGQQRPLSANITAEYGTFYSGHKKTLSIARGRVNLTDQLSAEPTYSWNRVEVREGAFTSHLAGSRVTYTMTPLMFVSALIQYNSGINAVSTNARLRWEYQPGSELFVVYNEDRNTLRPGFPSLSNRAFIIKVNKLFRF
jgi:hypothetical protein